MKITDTEQIDKPSLSYIKNIIDKDKKDEKWTKQYNILFDLFKNNPGNSKTDFDSVALKVSVLNDFYGTHIQDTYGFAEHIVNDVTDFDELVKSNNPDEQKDLIDRLENFHGKHMYSFATKYCHFHNPNDYPIYDSHVAMALKCYRNSDILSFNDKELQNYNEFKRVVGEFRKVCVQSLSKEEQNWGLKWLSYKRTDKFLWNLGKELGKEIDNFVEGECCKGVNTDSIVKDVHDSFGVEITTKSIDGIKNQPRFVIFGAGTLGERLFKFLRTAFEVVAFVDNNPYKTGKKYLEKPVISLEEYKKKYSAVPIIIATYHADEKIQRQLNDNNISNYFDLKDCPDCFYELDYNNLMIKIAKIIGDQEYLYGVNLLSYLIWQKTERDKLKSHINYIKQDKLNSGLLSSLPLSFQNDCIEVNDSIQSHLKYSCMHEKVSLGYDPVFSFSLDMVKEVGPRLKKLKDKYIGKRCFIVATGPSLRMEDLDTLHKHHELCFSMNRIYQAFNETVWRPDFYVVTDPKFDREEELINAVPCTDRFVSDVLKEYWKSQMTDNTFKLHPLFSGNIDKISDDLTKGYASCGTVTYACIQLALYMGFSKIYLLGVDCSNLIPKPGVKAHFSDNYDAGDAIINGKNETYALYEEASNESNSIKGYETARKYAEVEGKEIYNATRGGALEVFDRVDFDSLF